jgi:GNAT superfamily N-acetyltransferase
MSSPQTLTARSRALWASLAGVPVDAGRGVTVVATARSGLCPPSWVGVVVIGDAAIVTAPSARMARTLRGALAPLPVTSLTDPAALGAVLDLAEILGPATLAYLDAAEFRPCPAGPPVEEVRCDDGGLRALLAAAGARDADESGLDEITSPAFVARDGATVVAAAGYRDWPGDIAHLCVLVAEQARGRGLARRVASAAVAAALRDRKLPQWRARPEQSRRVARALGFREVGAQISVRVKPAGDARGT